MFGFWKLRIGPSVCSRLRWFINYRKSAGLYLVGTGTTLIVNLRYLKEAATWDFVDKRDMLPSCIEGRSKSCEGTVYQEHLIRLW